MTRPPVSALIAWAALVAASLCWPAAAAEPPPVDRPPTWASLGRAQQAALEPLHRDWATIDAEGKRKWIEVARHFPNLPAAERERIQTRMTEWARMTPTERGRARLQFQESRQMSPEDRQARWEAYKAMPPDERRALAQKARLPAKAAEPRASESVAKRNVVPAARQTSVKAVAPAVMQAKPGVSTTLMNSQPPPPTHQQPGLPKIVATPSFVDPQTLLPKRGPQGAAVQPVAPADGDKRR